MVQKCAVALDIRVYRIELVPDSVQFCGCDLY